MWAWFAATALACSTLTVVRGAHAESTDKASLAKSAEMMQQAHAAFDRNELDRAEGLFKGVIERGGLFPEDLLDCYVHVGAVRGAQGRKEPALLAFRRAALIDPDFKVPRGTPKKAVALAETARKEMARFGPVGLRLESPVSVRAGQPIRVTASIEAVHTAVIPKLSFEAKESLTGNVAIDAKPADNPVTFEVPAAMTLSAAQVSLTVSALDANGNAMATLEQKIAVEGSRAAAAAAKAEPPKKKPLAPATKSKGFWSTAWPYVLGGVLVAGGAVAIVVATRPPSTVSLGSPSVIAQ
ncbi:MAG: hypothetical protein U0169_13765 [Polyangiaceae bacterium]